MAKHNICPWWVGYFLISSIRRLIQDPVPILTPYVRAGMTVLEPGPGMGFFNLSLPALPVLRDALSPWMFSQK
jgi:hypothetical protein